MKLVSTRNSPEKYLPSKTSSWLRGLESIQVKSANANGVSKSTGGVAGGAPAGGASGCEELWSSAATPPAVLGSAEATACDLSIVPGASTVRGATAGVNDGAVPV